jgi:glycosyltransferase involved in cell wall biosynthesis
MKPSTPPLRVLHIVEATTAGVGRHVLDLSRQMHKAGLDVSVACPEVRKAARQDTSFVDRLRAAGVQVVIIPMWRRIQPLADMRAFVCLARLIAQGAYDVVHAHSSKAGGLGRVAAWRSEAAVVYTPNAFAFVDTGNRFRGWLYQMIERWLGQHMTDALICVSASELEVARRQAIAPSERLMLIENAIDAACFAPCLSPTAAKLRLGLDPGLPTVGYVGRLARQKGLEYLVQAARIVVDTWGDAQFVLVGEGELEGKVREMVASYCLDQYFLLTGHRTDVPQIFEALDVFVLPSLYEGLPYTLMEAMAAGRPVLATDVDGSRDLIEDGLNGVLVPPRAARDLAEALVYLLSAKDERERLGGMARAAALSRQTTEQMTQQVINLYERLLAGADSRETTGPRRRRAY